MWRASDRRSRWEPLESAPACPVALRETDLDQDHRRDQERLRARQHPALRRQSRSLAAPSTHSVADVADGIRGVLT
jgi:hypothetical protein